MKQITLTGERIVLRPWQDRDADTFAAMNSDARVMEFFVAPLSRAESDQLLSRMRGSDRGAWVGLVVCRHQRRMRRIYRIEHAAVRNALYAVRRGGLAFPAAILGAWVRDRSRASGTRLRIQYCCSCRKSFRSPLPTIIDRDV